MPFDIQSQANQLVLVEGPLWRHRRASPVPLTAAVDSKIQEVDFRRGDEGEGLVQINCRRLGHTDIEQQGQVVRIRFRCELPAN